MTATAAGGALAPLEVDGSLEQRDELAALVLCLHEQRRAILADYDRACAVLALIMQGSKRRSFSLPDGTTFELRSSSSYWCEAHNCPPPYCTDQHHDGSPVVVHEVRAEPYLSIRKPQVIRGDAA